MVDHGDERGFSLLEVVFCVGLLAMATAAGAGMFAAVARGAQPERTRDLALMVAENTLVRARAAASYAPNPLPNPDLAILRDYVRSRTWVLVTGPHTTTIAGKLVSPAALCGRGTTLDVPLAVTSDYEESAAAGTRTFTVTVAYPPNPCSAATQTVALSEDLPAVSFEPGTRVTHDLGDRAPWGQ